MLTEKQKKYFKEHPWLKTQRSIQNRCCPSGKYFKRGIRNFVTKEGLKYLWFRDKAYLMKQPNIDRINGKGNYTLNNCRYLEQCENCESKPVLQYNLDGIFIKRWVSQSKAHRTLKMNQGYISACCRGIYKTAYGFIWRFETPNRRRR